MGQHHRGALGLDGFAADGHLVGGSIVLGFAARQVEKGAAAFGFLGPQVFVTHQVRQAGVRDIVAVLAGEFFLDRHDVAVEADKQLADQGYEILVAARALDVIGSGAVKDAPDGFGRHFQGAADLSDALAGPAHGDHGLSVVVAAHGANSRWFV